MLAEAVISLMVLVGVPRFALIGSIGLARLPNFFTRLHGPTKATTLGASRDRGRLAHPHERHRAVAAFA